MFKPFPVSVWMLIVISIFIVSILLKLIFEWGNMQINEISTFILSTGVFCQQGINENIALMSSTKILLTVFFVTSILINNFYTSLVVSFLVHTNYNTNSTSLADLTNGNLPIGFYNTTATKNVLKVIT